jgi:serine/threonine protein phosphatase 1
MVFGLFAKRAVRAPSISAAVPAGQRIYAIGDVHGCLDLLDVVLAHIARDDEDRGAAETHLVFLGDLIDRGPHSAQVVERALEISRSRPNTHFLLGNHEEVFLTAVKGDQKALAFFTRIGGRETILSYGVTEEEYRGTDYPELLTLLQARVPDAHVAFLDGFEDMLVFGDYAFVHAGVRPSEPLARQKTSDLRWIRGEFLTHNAALEKIIVHGHTISDEVEVAAHRIGIDTGAYASGRLTAMGFEGGERWVLQS